MNSSSEVIMFFKSIFIASLVGSIVVYLILAISYSKIFKANGEKGWKGYVPIVNIWTLMKLSDMNPLAIFLLIVPIVNLFVMALLSVKLANKFSKSAGFAIGLLFLPFIFYPLLAISFNPKKDKVKEEKIKENKNIEDKKTVICPVCGTELKNGEKKCYVCDTEIENKKEDVIENNKVDTVIEKDNNFDNINENKNTFDNIENVSDELKNNGYNEIKQEESFNDVSLDNLNNNFENYGVAENNNIESYSVANNALEGYDKVENNNELNQYSKDNFSSENLTNLFVKEESLKENQNSNYFEEKFKNNDVIEHNKEVYRNPLDSNFDDLFLRNKNEETFSQNSIKEDERLFNEKVNNNELNISEIGAIDNYNSAPSIKIEEKPKYKSSTKTLDEILRINQNLYSNTKVNQETNEIYKELSIKEENNDDLIAKINELNKEIEEGLKEIREDEPKVKICKVCGTTIPSYSEKCLLCGSPVE